MFCIKGLPVSLKRLAQPQIRLSSSAAKTFAHQKSIPRLPIPPLQQTLDSLLVSVTPLAKSSSEVDTLSSAVRAFGAPGGIGETIQNKLIDYETTQPYSWLEQIWLDNAYLSYREPGLINVNWWLVCKDHPFQPKDLLSKPPPKGVLSDFQIQRAAGLVSNLLNFKDQLDSEQLPVDYAKDKATGMKVPLCMHQYTCQYGATRIPKPGKDEIYTPHPATTKHIIVMLRDQIYKVDVVHSSGARVTLAELQRVFHEVGADSLQSTPQPPIGILTGGHRDNWATAYEHLSKLSKQNESNLQIIKDALFVLCLDDHSFKRNIDISHKQWFHNGDARNRWFDKAIQLVVASSGRAGVNGEHTPADAVAPGMIFDQMVQNEPAIDPPNAKADVRLSAPQKLLWDVDGKIKSFIATAQKQATALINDTDSVLLQTDVYGGKYIKEIAKASPDAYLQLLLQLSWYRLHKEPAAVYESATIRRFLHGRTETARTFTPEAWAFVQSFDDDNVLYDTKRELFARAIKAHTKVMDLATTGNGIDRHLLGLSAMTFDSPELSYDEAYRNLFGDTLFRRSKQWRLSTSNMSPGRSFYAGFGTVDPNGYGINYAIGEENIKLSIASKKSSRETDGYDLRESIQRSMTDLMILFPKRSQVWGLDWKQKDAEAKKHEAAMGALQQLSDKYLAKKAAVKAKYETREGGLE
ncbi:acyltransferase ChoActase/COT/CPT [Cladochytrium replicatum]|nr:acyltransferase ChoActase/COT/CPT [Cladochytrium replicatum]